jgi:hypothetical protein
MVEDIHERFETGEVLSKLVGILFLGYGAGGGGVTSSLMS